MYFDVREIFGRDTMRNLVIAMLLAAIAVILLGSGSVWAQQDITPGPKASDAQTIFDKGSPTINVGPYDEFNWDVYIRNRPFNSAAYQRGTLFAPVDAILQALKFGYSQGDDGVVHITSNPGEYPTVTLAGNSLSCEYNGTNFSIGAGQVKGGIYVSLSRMCRNLGVSFIANSDTKIIDITVPQGMSVQQYQEQHKQATLKGMRSGSDAGPSTVDSKTDMDKTGSATASSTAKTMDTTDGGTSTSQEGLSKGSGSLPADKNVAAVQPADGKTEDSPIKQVGDIGGFADDTTGQCYWTATIKNTGDELVKNVVVTLHIQDGTGKDYSTQIKPIGNMNGGDQSKLEFYWQGMKYLIVTPKIEIKHDPLPKKEQKPAEKAMPPKASPKQAPASK